MTSIGEIAFSNNQIASLTLPDGVITIDDDAFSYNHLTNIIIPASVTSIGYSTFSKNNLSTITFQGNLDPLISEQEKAGNALIGWYSDETYETAWDFTNEIAANTTLYAKSNVKVAPPYIPPVIDKEEEQEEEQEEQQEEIISEEEITTPVEQYFTETIEHWAKNSINILAQKGIIKGFGMGLFGPHDYIQRHHFALIIDRLIKFDVVRDAVNFKDVPVDHPSYHVISNLQRGGIIDGYANLFNPSEKLTLGELSKILVNAFELEKADIIVENNHWSYIYTQTLVEVGILNKEEVDKGANEFLTRGLLADILYSLLQYRDLL